MFTTESVFWDGDISQYGMQGMHNNNTHTQSSYAGYEIGINSLTITANDNQQVQRWH